MTTRNSISKTGQDICQRVFKEQQRKIYLMIII